MSDRKFIFDLDGTLTRPETLPLIARMVGKEEEVRALTAKTVQGYVAFDESLAERLSILRDCDVSQVAALLGGVACFEQVVAFINAHADHCAIATGNLDVWIEQLARGFDCQVYSTQAIVEADKVIGLTHILQKEEIVRRYQTDGTEIVFIGDSHNDAEAMQIADISIACGLVHPPAASALAVCDHHVTSEAALLDILNKLATQA